MKRYICAALAAALLMPGMWAVSARAQDDDAAPEMGEHQGGGKMLERMKDKLGLTDEQAGKLQASMKAHHEAMRPLWLQAKDTMKKLGEQLKSKAPDAEIQASLDALKSAHKEIAAEDEKFRDGLASFLTPTQRAKMTLGMAMRMRRELGEHEEHGPRGKRGPKPGGKNGGEKDGDGD